MSLKMAAKETKHWAPFNFSSSTALNIIQENILKEASPLNIKIVIGYQTFGREFCIVEGELSNL